MTTLEEAKAEAIKRLDAEILKRTGGVAQGTITVRDYFAARAMEALIIQNKFYVGMDQPHWTKQCFDSAWSMADTMMKGRSK